MRLTVHQKNQPNEKAVQFSNLVARFRTKPVLSQKCAILDVLRRLADPGFNGRLHVPRTTAPKTLSRQGTEALRLKALTGEDHHAQRANSNSLPGSRERNEERGYQGESQTVESLPSMTSSKDSHPTGMSFLPCFYSRGMPCKVTLTRERKC